MINFNKVFLYLILILYINTYLFAQSPRVSIQGTLKDAKGAAAMDGTYSVMFRLYTTPTSGSAIWSEQAQVDLAGGIYSHYLGSITPLNSSDFVNPLFLGVQVGAIELSPRTELTYAPYAFAVQEVTCSGAVGDVKYSILDPVQFAAVNGTCWIPMDGRAIPGSKLQNILGVNNVPDGSGLFVRMQEYNEVNNYDPDRTINSPVANIQFGAVKPHTHSVMEEAHNHLLIENFRTSVGITGYAANVAQSFSVADDSTTESTKTTQSATSGVSINTSGATETRPKNLNFWIYVRID